MILKGKGERIRMMKRTIVRYINLAIIMTFEQICLPVKKRFPTLKHLEKFGILENHERKILEKLHNNVSQHPKHWVPLVWASSIVRKAYHEKIISEKIMIEILGQLNQGYRLTRFEKMAIWLFKVVVGNCKIHIIYPVCEYLLMHVCPAVVKIKTNVN